MKPPYYLTVFLFFLSFFCQGQIREELRANLAGQDLQLVQEAMKKSILLVRQDYVLQDGKNKFGKDGNPYFSRVYFIGICGKDNFLVNAKILTPWSIDGEFDEYRNSSTITPQLSKCWARELASPTFTEYNLPNINNEKYKDSAMVFLNINALKGGVNFTSQPKTKNGFLLWALASNDVATCDTCSLSFHVQKIEIDFSKIAKKQINKPNFLKKPVGGVFLVPEYGRGSIELRAAGYLVNQDGEWEVYAITSAEASRPGGALTPIVEPKMVNDEKKAELKTDNKQQTASTPDPVKKKKKKRKYLLFGPLV